MNQRSSQLRRRTRLVRLMAAAAVLALVPSVAVAQKSSPIEEIARDPRPFASLSNTAMSMRDSIVVVARSQIGTRYRFGGTTPSTSVAKIAASVKGWIVPGRVSIPPCTTGG